MGKEIREWDGMTAVAPHDWGKDHHSTMLYLETRAVDYKGQIRSTSMRSDGNAYPTFCKTYHLKGHNDWDCLADLATAGLLTFEGGVVTLTEEGWVYAMGLRRARAEAHLQNIPVLS